MDFAELLSLLQQSDETDSIEAKAASNSLGRSFLETVCAFCNEPDLGGGYILLGITKNETATDSRYIVTGVSDPNKLQQEIASQCRQCFNIPIRPSLKVISCDQKNIIQIHIPEVSAQDKPVYIQSDGIDRGAYRRIGPTDQICTREDLDFLYQLRSKRKYDETLLENASLTDFNLQAIRTYRNERHKIKPDAPELRYDDKDMLQALHATITEKGSTYPTIAGILLFGNPDTLNRICPLRSHIDYILVEGRKWMPDPDRRYTALELCEPLLTAIPKLLNQIMSDIPQTFALEDNGLQRKDNPLIPRKVVREGLVNAAMHRDYRVPSPMQIIKYANRVEFRNSGYSLKPHEQLGLPGSFPRNEIICKVLRDIHYAEMKGTGLSVMRDTMREANLSVPLIESDRSYNLFVLTLLSHHLFDKHDIEWLANFKAHHLTDEEARALIVIREMGAITNADYRIMNGIDTLTASSHLRRLRDLGLLEQKGRGNATYYTPTAKLLSPGRTPHTNSLSEGLTTGISPLSGELTTGISPLSGELTTGISSSPVSSPLTKLLSQELEEMISKITKRTPSATMRNIIKDLCSLRPLKISEISTLLKRSPKHMHKHYLKKMLDSEDLELTHPENPTHPQQEYRTKRS